MNKFEWINKRLDFLLMLKTFCTLQHVRVLWEVSIKLLPALQSAVHDVTVLMRSWLRTEPLHVQLAALCCEVWPQWSWRRVRSPPQSAAPLQHVPGSSLHTADTSGSGNRPEGGPETRELRGINLNYHWSVWTCWDDSRLTASQVRLRSTCLKPQQLRLFSTSLWVLWELFQPTSSSWSCSTHTFTPLLPTGDYDATSAKWGPLCLVIKIKQK